MTDENIDDETAELKQALAAVPKELLLAALSEHSEAISEEGGPRATKVVRAITHAQSFSGPLPPPQILQRYNDAYPGLANRIVKMAEHEQSHRHGIESSALTGSITAEKRGQNYALAICTLVVLASFGLIWQGHEVSGSILAGGTLSALAYVFITGRKEKQASESPKDSPGS